MNCSVTALGILSLAAAVLATPAARAQDTATEPATIESVRAHMIGLRFDWGSSLSYGLFYVHDWERTHTSGGLGATAYGGLGGVLTLVTKDHTRLDGLVLGPLCRFGVVGDAGIPAEGELHLGLAIDESSVGGAVTTGLLAGYRYFGLGYVYGFPVFPFRRPPWMAGHRFALRGAGAVHSDSTTEIRTE